ncbi:MAG: LuxR C-terminal-related transcriptional regulator [Raoultibacter sp.]
MEKRNTTGAFKAYLGSVSLADILNSRMLGFALTRTWAYVMFFSTVIHFSVRNDIPHLNSTETWSSLGLVVLMVVCALCARPLRQLLSHKAARLTMPVVLCLVTALLALVEADWFRQPWCSILSVISGVGLGFLYLAWGEAYTRLNAKQAAVEALTSFLVAALVFPLIIVLPHLLAVVITMVLPLVSAFILFKVLGVWSKPSLLEPVKLNKSAFLIKALLSVGIFGFAESLMRSLFIAVNPVVDVDLYPWVFLVATLLSAAIMSVTVIARKNSDYGFAYRVVLFATAFVFLLLPIMERGTFVADVLALVGYCIVSLLVWVMLARTASTYHLSATVVFGCGIGSMVAGGLGGTFLGSVLLSYVDMTYQLLSLTALLCVCGLFFAYLFLFSERAVIKLTQDESTIDGPRPFRRRCEEVAAAYKLSAKEAEVMILVAKGRSTPRICEELDISQGTANTHLTHIYKKIDVHDKQQLLDVLEGRIAF